MNEEARCPVTGGNAKHAAGGGTSNRDWWPNQLKVELLRQLRADETSPEKKEALLEAILLSVNGIAAGLQNTG